MIKAILELEKNNYDFSPLKMYNFKKSTRNMISNNTIEYTSIPCGLLLCTTIIDYRDIVEVNELEQLSMMIDLSRGRVMTVTSIKDRIRKLALLGFTSIILYLEDLIPIDEPYYGYLRNGYSEHELKQIIEYSSLFEIEVIPQIQTLGHMEHFLKWQYAEKKYGDTDKCLITNDLTYDLLEKVISKCACIFGNNKIHIGLDEAFDMGRGRAIKKNGYIAQKDIFRDHIIKIQEICNSLNYSEIHIWSDMLFAIFNDKGGEGIYHRDFTFPIDFIEILGSNLYLYYWNYWSMNKNVYDETINIHKQISQNIVASFAAHSHQVPFHEKKMMKQSEIFSQSAHDNNIKRFVLCSWLDDGSYCTEDSINLSIFNHLKLFMDLDLSNEHYNFVFKKPISDQNEICSMHNTKINISSLLWDDPIYQISLKNQRLIINLEDEQKKLIEIFENINVCNSDQLGYTLAKFLIVKLDVNLKLLNNIVDELKINELIQICDDILELYEEFWISNYKITGFERLSYRFSGQKERYKFILRMNTLRSTELTEILNESESTYTWIPQTFNFLSFPDKNRWD